MTRALAIAAAAAVLAAFLMPAAQAQQRMPCAPRSSVVAGLSGPDHNERPTLRGITPSGNMLEVWLSDAGGFSIILTRPEGGLSCMLSAGQAMHAVPPPPSGDGHADKN